MMDGRSPLRRDPWSVAWRLASGGQLLAAVLLGLAVYLLLLTLIPQVPADPLMADRWLAQAQARFGSATGPVYRLGLFSLAGSPIPRLLLILIGFLLLAGGSAQVERLLFLHRSGWRQGWRETGAAIARTAACLGPLLLLLGLLVNQRWGWRVDGLVGRPGEPLDVPGHGRIPLRLVPSGIRSASPGVAVYVTDSGPELRVRAYDASGNPLPLQRTPRDAAQRELVLRLFPNVPEAFFAISDGELIGRASALDMYSLSAESPLYLQLFRPPSGDQVYQTELTGEEVELEVEGMRLRIIRSSYLLLAASHSPGRWLQEVGIVLTALGLIALSFWEAGGEGWRRRAGVASAALLALLTLAAAGMALRSLVKLGLVWDRSATQAGFTIAWLIALAGRLFLTQPTVEEGEER